MIYKQCISIISTSDMFVSLQLIFFDTIKCY